MATSKISTHTGTLQTITVSNDVELLQNNSKIYPNGQKLIQIQIRVNLAISRHGTFLWVSNEMKSQTYVSLLVVDTNTSNVYVSLLSQDGTISCRNDSIPPGYYTVTAMYE